MNPKRPIHESLSARVLLHIRANHFKLLRHDEFRRTLLIETVVPPRVVKGLAENLRHGTEMLPRLRDFSTARTGRTLADYSA
jgi:hypothetical protein